MNKAEKQVAAASLRDEATVIRQTRENYKEARANIEEKLKVLADREQTQSVIWQRQYQQALKQQLDTAIDTLSKKNYSNIHQYLEGEYENGYIGTMYSLQKQGIPLVMPIDQTRVVKMVETTANDIKLSKRLYGNTTKLKNAVRREVSIGFASGESYQDVAARLSRTMDIDYNKTIRIARTEGGRVQNASRFEASVQAKKCGADIVKQWDSTLDNRTRWAHRELDGQVQELEEPFKAEGQEAQHPHGFGVPWMDVNCRCVVLQRARWAVEGEGYDDYTKYSRFADFERESWLDGSLDATVQKHGGQIIDLSDARNFETFKANYKKAASNIVAMQAAAAIGVEVMGAETLTINRDAAVYSTLQTEHVNAIAGIVENAESKRVAEAYLKFEKDLDLLDGKHKGGAHFTPKDDATGKVGVRMNVANSAQDNNQKDFATWFHEFGHHIDYLATGKGNTVEKFRATKKLPKDMYASVAYKDNLFGRTLAKEVDDLVKARQKELKAIYEGAMRLDPEAVQQAVDKGLIRSWNRGIAEDVKHLGDKEYFAAHGYGRNLETIEQQRAELLRAIKYDMGVLNKAKAFISVEHELELIPLQNRTAISDIFEGATRGKVQAGWGHGKTYWKDQDDWTGVKHSGVSKEAFAEYVNASMLNPEMLEVLNQYLPESSKVFDEIIEAILKGEI